MNAQVMDATISVRTDIDGADTEIGIYRADPSHLRLYVIPTDGSYRVELVHFGGNRERSMTFLRSLVQHAQRMLAELAGPPDGEKASPEGEQAAAAVSR